jgi:hypothetical protein
MAGDGGSPKRWSEAWRLLPGLPLTLALFVAWGLLSLPGKDWRSGSFLIGDCPYYASAAVSLWHDHDLDLHNQLKGGLEIHQRQVSLGARGEWYPKHPILLSVLSAPFYAAFSVAGFLYFNLLVLTLLGATTWALARHFVSVGTATLATVLVFGGSFLRAYAYNFSPDLLSTLAMLAGILAMLKSRPLLAGASWGLGMLAKVSNLFVAALILVFLVFRKPRADAVKASAALLPSLAAWALLNVSMFGSPTLTGYDRTIVLDQGRVTTISHRGFFDLPVMEGIRGQLLDPRLGLLTTSPLLLLALPGLLSLLRKHPWEGLLILGVSEFLFLLFSTYRWWATSHYGNRFLMLPVVLAVVPMAYSLEALERVLATFVPPRDASLEASGGR